MKKLPIILLLMACIISCKKSVKPIIKKDDVPHNVPHNVLILGNSITYSPPNISIGWHCDCGMAASVADSDYVHLLTARFKTENSSTVVAAKNIAQFEREFDTYDFADSLKLFVDAKPDIIIMRIGENVTRFTDSVLFEKKYADLLTYLKTNSPGVKILAAGSVWPDRDLSNRVMAKYSDYITLISLEDDQSNFAYGLFDNSGVQAHPSNKGMRSISDQTWQAVKKWL